MKKVFCKMALTAVLALTTLFTGCKAPSSGGGGNSFNALETPLTLEAITAGQITFNNLDKITNLKYKLNDGDPIEITENSGSKSIQVSANDVVSLFAQGTSNTNASSECFKIDCSSDCYVYGNVMSLLTDNYKTATKITQDYAFTYLFNSNTNIKNHSEKELVLPATTLKDYCYRNMFEGCTSLTKAPELPADTMKLYCYGSMFKDCTLLTEAPELPATTLAASCYTFMFRGCTSLTQAPDLPATSLMNFCYNGMFELCTSLTTAPVLSATTLPQGCYYYMFSRCTSLKKVECLATDISAEKCTVHFLAEVASSGTFIKASSMND
ncbi:hypothetical protein [Treponema sp.]|uniref:hypothetical protein n=1 Tax=Treponema sp. TaxID=166 RepID=UPI00298E901B|nr:hypothetical protein [Treponema sp.]